MEFKASRPTEGSDLQLIRLIQRCRTKMGHFGHQYFNIYNDRDEGEGP